MSDFNFKEGDLVYYPTVTNAIVKLKRSLHLENYSLLGEWYSCDGAKKCALCFLSDGRLSFTHQNSSIFPATQEWYDKLIHVYPNLEKPPGKKTPKEIIQAMLDSGWVGVACYVNDVDKRPCKNNKKDFIVLVRDDSFEHIYSGNYCNWKYANPFDPKTGEVIIDFVNGEVVLED